VPPLPPPVGRAGPAGASPEPPRSTSNPGLEVLRGLEFGHSGGPELSERHSVLLGGGGSYQGLVGDRCLSGGKGRRVVNQLLAQQRDQIQTGGSLGSAAPFGQGRIDFGPFGSVAFQAG